MGVKNFNKLLQSHAPDCVHPVTLADMRGWRVGIDTSVAVYQLWATGEAHKIRGTLGTPVNHIQGIFYQTAKLLRHGIIPVYVLDGTPPEQKSGVLQQRRNARAKGAVKVPSSAFQEVVELLQLMGVAVVRAPGEAEAQLAYYNTAGLIDAVATEDTDAIIFGAPVVLQHLYKDTCHKIVHAELLQQLQFDQPMLVRLALQLGCDYTPASEKTYGIVAALKRVRQNEDTPQQQEWSSARLADLFLRPLVCCDVPAVVQAPDVVALRKLLLDVHGLKAARIDGTLAAGFAPI